MIKTSALMQTALAFTIEDCISIETSEENRPPFLSRYTIQCTQFHKRHRYDDALDINYI